MIVIVCGGRHYNNVAAVYFYLDLLHAKRGISLLIQGGQSGADHIAKQWAIDRGIPWETEEAEWKKFGPAAGPIRNGAMLKKWDVKGLVAFPGGRGTADMIKQAKAAGIEPWQPLKAKV